MRMGLVLALLLAASPLRAEVAGASDPGFVAAFGTWLEGDEAAALPALAALARSDNTAAQLTLAMIDATPVMQGDWLMAETRAERITLLRPGQGLSGGSWMPVAAAHDPVAATWLRLWDSTAAPQIILDFAALHEPRAARVAALTLAARQVHGFAAVADQPGYPAELQVYAVLEAAVPQASTLAAGDPQRALLGPVPAAPALAVWLAGHARGDPLVAFCAAHCPDEPQGACLPAAFAAVGGYHALMRMGSPFEALVSSADYNRSRQGLDTALRRMVQRQKALGMKTVPEGSACLADLLK